VRGEYFDAREGLYDEKSRQESALKRVTASKNRREESRKKKEGDEDRVEEGRWRNCVWAVLLLKDIMEIARPSGTQRTLHARHIHVQQKY